MNIFHTKRLVQVCTSTTATAEYGAGNVLDEAIRRAWWAAGTGAETFTVQFAGVGPLAAVLLQDVNWVSCPFEKSADGTTFTSAGTLTSHLDPKIPGRRRALMIVSDPNVKAFRLLIPSGATTDGAPCTRIGTLYAFAAVSALPVPPEFGARIRAVYPQLATELVSKRVGQAATGESFNELELSFERLFSESLEELIRRSRAGTIGLQLAMDNYPEAVWPVAHQQDDCGESFDFYNYSRLNLTLREAV